jgi:hypothetical protein
MSFALAEVLPEGRGKIARGIIAIGVLGLGVIAGVTTGILPPAVPEWCSEPPHVDTPDTPGRTPPIIIARPVSPTERLSIRCVGPVEYKIGR